MAASPGKSSTWSTRCGPLAAEPLSEAGPKPLRRAYGRRLGRKLSARRRELLAETLPRLCLPSGAIAPAALFPEAADLWLEIGYGGGEHLAWQAERHPEIGFIGCELFQGGVASLVRHVDERGLANIRHAQDGHDVLERLPEAALGRCFLLFPDPWPKYRHWKRRFVRRESLDALARALRPGGEFRFASDDAELAAWTLMHLLAHPAFDWPARGVADWDRRPEDWPETRYERKAIAQGRHPIYLRFLRQG
ncbi:MAG: tRNA (guanosine(46)-N7)-methyltransferase TrmB [Alphaproteobacteria bacterium]|nr:tRNA (guanosine(46)-N7)-methyltransferase TrmB [Alphaproteobacteria bacterium]